MTVNSTGDATCVDKITFAAGKGQAYLKQLRTVHFADVSSDVSWLLQDISNLL